MWFYIAAKSEVETWYAGAVQGGPFSDHGVEFYKVQVRQMKVLTSSVGLRHADAFSKIKLTQTIQGHFVWQTVPTETKSFWASDIRVPSRRGPAGFVGAS
jgi:hypothetical protein